MRGADQGNDRTTGPQARPALTIQAENNPALRTESVTAAATPRPDGKTTRLG